jgi:predicted permease
MDSLRLDLRYAVRSLLSRPGFSAIAILTLALGIGVNTVAFTAMNALLFRPFRIADADRIGWVMVPGPGNPRGYATSDELVALERGAASLDGIGAEARIPVSLRTAAGTEQGWALLVTSNYLRTLGAQPDRGRIFAEADVEGSELPTVVAYRFWKDKLGAPESLAGQTVVANGRSFSVVGVLPDDFQGPGGLYAPDMWLPLARMDVLNLPAERTTQPWLTMFARLRPGANRAQAEAELTSVARTFAAPPAGSGDPARTRTAVFHPMSDGHPDLQEISSLAWLALAVVGVVLLIACFNVASLMMARAMERQKEISIRSAIGASRARILRQLVTEGLLLAILSGAAALLVAAWSEQLLATFSLPAPIPQRLHLGVDRLIVAFTVALVLVAGVLPALLPALQSTRANLLRSINSQALVSGRPSRARNAFVITQIAGSTLFIVAALLFVRSFVIMSGTDTGFDTKHTAVLQLSPSSYGYDDQRSQQLFDNLRGRLSALPGVRSVGLADRVPFYVGGIDFVQYTLDGADCAVVSCPQARTYSVGADHFAALGIPMHEGREFTDRDLLARDGVIISRHLARQLWPGGTAVGRSLRVGEKGQLAEVIGVAADIKHRSLAETPDAYIYRPLGAGDYARGLSVVVRASDDPRLMLAAMREQVRALDPELPSGAVATMTERMKLPLWAPRTAAGFFAICATLAVALGSAGLFGVMYLTVSQRTREFGIRAALGASRRRIITFVLREGLRLAVPGVALGAVAGYVAGRLLARGLHGVSPADPLTFAATAAIEVAITLAACALPAHRATKADPVAALQDHGLRG